MLCIACSRETRTAAGAVGDFATDSATATATGVPRPGALSPEGDADVTRLREGVESESELRVGQDGCFKSETYSISLVLYVHQRQKSLGTSRVPRASLPRNRRP